MTIVDLHFVPNKAVIILFLAILLSGFGSVSWAVEDGGNAEEQYALGMMYAQGTEVPKDYAEAAKWFSLAADQGHTRAMCSLGSIYYEGQGVEKDPITAVYIWSIAAVTDKCGADFLALVKHKMDPEFMAEAREKAIEYVSSQEESPVNMEIEKSMLDMGSIDSKKSVLQYQIDNIPNDPTASEKALLQYDLPIARIFLAYLYHSNLIGNDTPHPSVTTLLSQIKTEVDQPDDGWDAFEKDWEGNKYEELDLILTHLFHLYLSKENSGICIPEWLFKKHTSKMLDASWIGTYGGFSSVFILGSFCRNNESDYLHNLTKFNTFEKLLYEIYGNPGVGKCSGTREYHKQAIWEKTEHIASIAPAYYFNSSNKEIVKENYEFLKIWSNKGIWNKRKYKQLIGVLDSVKKDLGRHYSERFKLDNITAQKYAQSVMEEYIDMYTGSYPGDAVFEDSVYSQFTSDNITIEDIENLMPLQQEDLDRALRLAVITQQSSEVIKYLINNGANINSGDESAIILAVDQPQLLKILIDAGGDVNYENCFGKTAIYYAIQYDELETAKILIAAGADINHETLSLDVINSWKRERPECNDCYNISVGNRTPLMYAWWQGSVDMIKLLFENKADPSIFDSDGHDIQFYSDQREKYGQASIPLFGVAEASDLSFKSGKDTYELEYKAKDVTTSDGSKNLVLYSVYKNGGFVHSEKEDGGRFFSCKHEQPEVRPVKALEKQIGWVLLGGDICGNTFSYKAEIIIPVERHSTTYYSKTITSKKLPLIESLKNGVSIWYFEQNWGKGGTATSFFVPSKITINLDDEYIKFKKGNILNGIGFLERYNPHEWLQSFLGFYVAGIRDVNPKLMQYALDNYYNDEQIDWISVHFQSGDKGYLEQLIEKVRTTQELLKETNGVVVVEAGS